MLRLSSGDCFGILMLVVWPVTPEPELTDTVQSALPARSRGREGGHTGAGAYTFSGAGDLRQDNRQYHHNMIPLH